MRTGSIIPRYLCAFFLLLAGCVLWQAPARASGDFGCDPSWRLAHRAMTGCDSMAVMNPGNDTRANLVLLMLDLRGGKGIPATAPAAPDAIVTWADLVRAFEPPTAGKNGDGNGDDSSYATGEGSRCRSDAAGAAAFAAALQASANVPEAERTALIAARKSLQPSCTGASAGAAGIAQAGQQVRSAAGKAFALYLRGALAFYDGDYDAAATAFAGLGRSDQPWLRETARYMAGRVELNRAQIDAFDDYGSPVTGHKPDARVLAVAEAALGDYLKAYPRGLYAGSARGLLRRVYWLAGDTARLANAYAALLALDPATRGVSDADLAQEIDNKLLSGVPPTDLRDPALLAVVDLLQMRGNDRPTDTAPTDKPLALAALQAQRPAFAANPALFDYLLAVHAYYVEGKPADVLRLIPDASHQPRFSYLQFSRQVLRGMALEAMKDRNARGFWADLLGGSALPLQRPAIELAIAWHDERAHALAALFAPGSPVRGATLHEILLTNVADAALLRRQATDPHAPPHEREVALFVLLYKEVSRGAYRDYLRDLALIPPGAPSDGDFYSTAAEHLPFGIFTQTKTLGDYGCPALKDTASRLAQNPQDGKAQLCLGEFIRVNSFDETPLDTQPHADELGGSPSLFPGPAYSRLEVYRRIIADAKAAPGDKAYALYRAVNCYAPTGTNGCAGPGVPKEQRRAWFQQLKKTYPASPWAQSLAYYW
jgi:hypothetical protein